MDELLQHPRLILEVALTYWAFSALVGGMPDPPLGSFYYKWLYTTLHLFAGNVKQFADSKIGTMTATKTETVVVKKTEETK